MAPSQGSRFPCVQTARREMFTGLFISYSSCSQLSVVMQGIWFSYPPKTLPIKKSVKLADVTVYSYICGEQGKALGEGSASAARIEVRRFLEQCEKETITDEE